MESIDFLPELVRAQRARRRRIVREGYLLAGCLAGLALLGYVRQGRLNEARGELAILNSRSDNVRNQLAVREDLERQQAELMAVQRIESNLGSRANVLDILAELQRVMPASIALTDLLLEIEERKIPLTPARINRTARPAVNKGKKKFKVVKRLKLTITGLSPTDVDVANFIAQLSANALFEDVNMGYTKNIDFRGRSARQFETSCYIVR